jgi:hypothetical protein
MPLLARLASPGAAGELAAQRVALGQLRVTLNQQATAKLEGLMAAALSRPHAGPKQD